MHMDQVKQNQLENQYQKLKNVYNSALQGFKLVDQ